MIMYVFLNSKIASYFISYCGLAVDSLTRCAGGLTLYLAFFDLSKYTNKTAKTRATKTIPAMIQHWLCRMLAVCTSIVPESAFVVNLDDK